MLLVQRLSASLLSSSRLGVHKFPNCAIFPISTNASIGSSAISTNVSIGSSVKPHSLVCNRPNCRCNLCFPYNRMNAMNVGNRRSFSTSAYLKNNDGFTPVDMFKAKPDSVSMTSQTTVENTSSGKTMIERINIYKNWNSYSKVKKSFFLGYLLMATGAFAFNTYNDGKKSLIKYKKETRAENRNDNDLWKSVKDGCSYTIWENFFDSFLFPFTFFSNMMPSVVIFLNKDKPTKSPSP